MACNFAVIACHQLLFCMLLTTHELIVAVLITFIMKIFLVIQMDFGNALTSLRARKCGGYLLGWLIDENITLFDHETWQKLITIRRLLGESQEETNFSSVTFFCNAFSLVSYPFAAISKNSFQFSVQLWTHATELQSYMQNVESLTQPTTPSPTLTFSNQTEKNLCFQSALYQWLIQYNLVMNDLLIQTF